MAEYDSVAWCTCGDAMQNCSKRDSDGERAFRSLWPGASDKTAQMHFYCSGCGQIYRLIRIADGRLYGDGA